MKHFIVYFWFLISYSSCLNKSSTETVPHDVKNLFQNVTLSPVDNAINKTVTAENFAEGGSHNSNKIEIITSTPPTLIQAFNSSIDLISNGAPSGTSGIKARKGVHLKKIAARKGAPPCLEESTCKPLASIPSSNETSPPPVYEPSTADVLPVFPLLNTTQGAKVEASSPSPTLLPKKPTITLVPADSDTLYTTLKTERNVVIPIVALVCAPLIVMIVLIIYKRVRDSRGNSQYMRMGFLIEDIYND